MSDSPSWTELWAEHVLLAREYMHEVLTRRGGSRADSALVIANRARAAARALAECYGGGSVGEHLEAATSAMTEELIGLIAALAGTSNDSMRTSESRVAGYRAAARSVSDALAEAARRRGDTETPEAMHTRLLEPLVAALLLATVEYDARHYLASYDAISTALSHAITVLAPFMETLIVPASLTKVGALHLLRRERA